jgi:spore coat protein CotH
MKRKTTRSQRVAALAIAGLFSLSACGTVDQATTTSITEQTTAAAVAATSPASTDAGSAREGGEVFDSSYVHEITVEFDEDDYDAMIEEFTSSGDKEWIEATVTINGVAYEGAGIRLKGNSSLQSLTGGGGATDLSTETPEELPWLIKLDKYVEGQNPNGVNDFVVRSNTSETSLNEAVALDLLEAAGLAAQDSMAVSFSVNGSEQELRLVIEHPDDIWMTDNFDAEGALYKAESTGDYSYRGEDPDAYDEVFDQKAGEDNEDLTPLLEFLEFINTSDDGVFAAELDEWLDVDAFATYLAMQDIVQNFDDIDGPGNNSYLYYDTEQGEFTIVPWDYNESLGIGPSQRLGGFEPGQLGDPGQATEPGEIPEGLEAGGMPTGPEAGAGPDMNQSNVLVERFLAVDEFAALYEQQLTELQASLIDSGLAADILATWVEVLEQGASDLVPVDTIETEASAITELL